VLAGNFLWRRDDYSLGNTLQQRIVNVLPHTNSFACALKLIQRINSVELHEQGDTRISLGWLWSLLSRCYNKCFIAAVQQLKEGIVHWNQLDGLECYFHLHYMSEFCIHKLCNTCKLDGMPWDPRGVGSESCAIACGQAMFCPGGNVTPDIP
jgi:hypothetical protein